MKYIIVFFTFILTTQAHALCSTTQYKYTNEGVEKRIPIKICKKDNLLSSKNCQDLKCNLYKKSSKNVFQPNSNANPGFVLCHKINGRPIVGEYFSKRSREWIRMSLCFDEKFREFLPISLMIRIAAGFGPQTEESQTDKTSQSTDDIPITDK